MRGGAIPVTGKLLGEETRRGRRRKIALGSVIIIYLIGCSVLLVKYGETAYDRFGGFVILAISAGILLLVLQTKPLRIYENGVEYGHVLKYNFIHWDNIEAFEDMEENGFLLRFHDPNVIVSAEGVGEPKMITIGRTFPNYHYVKEYVQRKVEPPTSVPIPVEVRN